LANAAGGVNIALSARSVQCIDEEASYDSPYQLKRAHRLRPIVLANDGHDPTCDRRSFGHGPVAEQLWWQNAIDAIA
jgi:hypothetical protein